MPIYQLNPYVEQGRQQRFFMSQLANFAMLAAQQKFRKQEAEIGRTHAETIAAKQLILSGKAKEAEAERGAVELGGKQLVRKPPSYSEIRIGGYPAVMTSEGTIQFAPKPTAPPSRMVDFELTYYGKLAPELRGTPEYKSARLNWLRQTKQASPYTQQMQQQLQFQKHQAGTNLRKEFNALPEIKDYTEITQRFQMMQEAMEEAKTTKNFVAVDQALISTFNKITDPDSVVRESEYARTASDLSLLNRLKGKIAKLGEGGPGLTPEDRKAIVRLSKRFQAIAARKHRERLHEYRGYIAEYGLDPKKYISSQPEKPVSEMTDAELLEMLKEK